MRQTTGIRKTQLAQRSLRVEKRINASQDFSDGTKLLAVCLCDTFVGKSTGRCWPNNKTIAKAMGKSKRSVQRNLAVLHGGGWITYVTVRGRRRTIQISFPGGVMGDTKGDTKPYSTVTNRTQYHATDDTHYKNQVNNQEKGGTLGTYGATILVRPIEKASLEAWAHWIETHTEHLAADVFCAVIESGGYLLPSRYPNDDQDLNARYRAYFENVL